MARSNAEAAAARWMAEPVRDHTFSQDTVLGLLASTATYVRSVVTLQARLPPSGPPRPGLGRLTEELTYVMSEVAKALRSGTRAAPLPRLRQTQLELAGPLGHRLNPDPREPCEAAASVTATAERPGSPQKSESGQARQWAPGTADGPALVLVTETDLIVNSVNTLGHLLALKEQD